MENVEQLSLVIHSCMHLLRSDLEYELPESLIAREPARPRDSARMLVLDRSTETIEHRLVSDIGEYLVPGDLLCLNNTSVLPARLCGTRADTGGKVEGLYLESTDDDWLVMLKSNGKLRAGQEVELVGPANDQGLITLIERREECWLVHPTKDTLLESVGHTPVPPYIIRARGGVQFTDSSDRDWYRTVYADACMAGSVAAPTAGFHFTNELLDTLQCDGVDRTSVTLHVGAGTFLPIQADDLADHRMHEETWSITTEALAAIGARRGEGAGRIIAVGTTTARLLESLPTPLPGDATGGRTSLMITPPHDFTCVDALMTNFHLPCSTLLALVAAMTGLDCLKSAYAEAVAEGYRFYSYGDAMLIL